MAAAAGAATMRALEPPDVNYGSVLEQRVASPNQVLSDPTWPPSAPIRPPSGPVRSPSGFCRSPLGPRHGLTQFIVRSRRVQIRPPPRSCYARF
ncbi:hypothetical protein E2C01_058221 [Portunus trituberculatus]|uniref:Uncharacterized protein n=1 Tax=Portunus trituberculatus TaxID=210409 RepID=A0A5B7GVU1_PORTR|nr:hypothetical protein [Portunus trituberculatus]